MFNGRTCLFEDDVIEYFNDYWNEYSNTDRLSYEEKYYKLHKVRRLHPYSTHKEFFDKIKYFEQVFPFYKLNTCYFLEYGKGSFAELHHDHISKLTTVTMLNKSEDLIGGEFIISDDNDSTSSIIDLRVGETYFLDQTVKHGVAKIVKGTRLVLITWMK
jgi:hypothetical protein|tara:strand:+ start:74 stop:550 length:477 start_codon:yes stop_codon:yes gene_type:complete